MKNKNTIVSCAIIFLMVLALTVLFPCRSGAQEIFPNQTPSQEFMQNNKNAPAGGMLKAGGGTGSGDPIDPGTGGTDPGGFQNDTEVPVKDAGWLLYLLAAGYGLYRRKKTSTAEI